MATIKDRIREERNGTPVKSARVQYSIQNTVDTLYLYMHARDGIESGSAAADREPRRANWKQ